MAGERRLSTRISDEAHEGWYRTPRVYGGTMSSLAEVIGLELAELDGPMSSLPKHWRVWFVEAARLDEINRRNQGREK